MNEVMVVELEREDLVWGMWVSGRGKLGDMWKEDQGSSKHAWECQGTT